MTSVPINDLTPNQRIMLIRKLDKDLGVDSFRVVYYSEEAEIKTSSLAVFEAIRKFKEEK